MTICIATAITLLAHTCMRYTVGLKPSSVEFSLFSLTLNSDDGVDDTPQLHVIENNYKIINISFQSIT